MRRDLNLLTNLPPNSNLVTKNCPLIVVWITNHSTSGIETSAILMKTTMGYDRFIFIQYEYKSNFLTDCSFHKLFSWETPTLSISPWFALHNICCYGLHKSLINRSKSVWRGVEITYRKKVERTLGRVLLYPFKMSNLCISTHFTMT
jgi:hypothetical protein